MPQSRQLAAIMFTDIVGYTTLMGNDEKKAFELLNKNRQIQKPIIEQYNGRWIKELGDGVMASFNTASDAVNAAMKIQEACNAAKNFQLKIGIHLGEVVFENDDVYGDGVNIASRIETLGVGSSVLMSKSIRDQVKNHAEFQITSLGPFELKNVGEAVEVFAIAKHNFPFETSKKQEYYHHLIIEPMSKVKRIPEGVPAVLPILVCRDVSAEVDFCKTTFNALEGVRRPGPDGNVAHAALTINGAMIMIECEWPTLSSRSPQADGSSPVIIYVYVEDVDSAIDKAVAAGAKILLPAKDQFWGDRTGRIMDPEGHVWTISSRIEETTSSERDDRWSKILNS